MKTRRKVTHAEILKVQTRAKENGCTTTQLMREFGRTWKSIQRMLEAKIEKPVKRETSIAIANKALQAANEDPVAVALRHLVDLLVERAQLTGDIVEEVHVLVPTRSAKMFVKRQIEITV
jgi:hypothetical protein